MKRPVVLSLEQALSLPSATARMVRMGWRVIRVESPAGDPNRRIGLPVGGADRCAYFVGPNAGKEAVTLDLGTERGREVLHALIERLPVDVFCVNTLPSRYSRLGVDPETLRRIRPELVWAGISAMGPERGDVPGYDPAIQALTGFADLTGPADGPPMLCGVPIVDLKAGDELLLQVLAALLERRDSGEGALIHVSMARAAASWLITVLPMLDAGARPEELTRSGSEHRHFVPSNSYPTSDGFVYLAIGSDGQWERLTELRAFRPLREERFRRNAGRKDHRKEIHERIARITATRTTLENLADLSSAGIVCAPVLTVAEAAREEWLDPLLAKTTAPDGREIRLPPSAAGPDREELSFPPRPGEHTVSVLAEAGFSPSAIEALVRDGVASVPPEIRP